MQTMQSTFVDNTEDLDVVLAMCNLLEYSRNYPMSSGNLWNYYRNQVNNGGDKNNAAINKINNSKSITSKSFEYKAKLIGRKLGPLYCFVKFF